MNPNATFDSFGPTTFPGIAGEETVVIQCESSGRYVGAALGVMVPGITWTSDVGGACRFVGERGVDKAATIASELSARGYHVSIVTL